MFENILVGIDGSEHAAKAVETASRMAKIHKSKITLVYVTDPLSISLLGRDQLTVNYLKLMEASGKEILESSSKKIEHVGMRVETVLLTGHIPDQIIEYADKGTFDLIVLGSRGIGKAKLLLLGSVSDTVLRNSNIPVLIAK